MVSEEALSRARAARVLLRTQALAEGTRLAHQALALAAPSLSGSKDEVDALLASPLPRFDREVSRADVDRAERALSLLETTLAPQRGRAQRTALIVASVALVAALVVRAFWPAPDVEVTASASYSTTPTHGPASTVDGDPATNWLLPDRTPGWVDLRFASPRSVSAIEITNGHNAPYEDRAAREVEVMIFGEGGQILGSATRELAFSSAPGPERFEVAADRVTRVRVYVRSFHRAGGALDQIQVIP